MFFSQALGIENRCIGALVDMFVCGRELLYFSLIGLAVVIAVVVIQLIVFYCSLNSHLNVGKTVFLEV